RRGLPAGGHRSPARRPAARRNLAGRHVQAPGLGADRFAESGPQLPGRPLMRISLAARSGRRDQMREIRDQLVRSGHEVVSRWIGTTYEEKDATGSSAAPAEYRQAHAVENLADVVACDCLIAFAEPPHSNGRGGR